MKKQSGFTLIELAIVLVIIGLLLGGVLKGQELINSAKVKNLAGDFKNIPVYVYGYQDKYKVLPGDDNAAGTTSRPSGEILATTPATKQGNGAIDGVWDSNTGTDESILFWQHVRLAGLAAGPTDDPSAFGAPQIAAYVPTNAMGGRIGISSTKPITTMNNSAYYMCSAGIDAKFVLEVDRTLDDGDTTKGSVQAIAYSTAPMTSGASVAVDNTSTGQYTICMGF